jgi:hypothetical protein
MKLVLRPRSTLVAKAIPKLPGAVLGTSPIVVTPAGINYVVGLNLATLASSIVGILPTPFTIEIEFDGAGSVLPAGLYSDLSFNFNCTITGVRLLADQVGSAVFDLWRDTYANFPPTITDTIVAAAPPTLTAAQKSEDVTLAGWNKTVTSGDTIRAIVQSAATVKKVTMALTVVRSP